MHDGQQRDWLDSERIVSYQHIKVSAEQHLHETYSHINVLPCEDNILLYNVHGKPNTNRGVSVQITMRLLPDMTVRVFLRNEILPNSELNWVLSHTNGILLF